MNKCFGCKKTKSKIGILIAQLGTPDAPDKKSLRRYLKEFLSDKRVIEVNKYLWWIILRILLLFRPKRSAALYKRIWLDEGSPLLVYTQKLTNKLKERFKENDDIIVDFGMRYGTKSITETIKSLKKQGCDKIFIFNMYPQYSATTTAANYDAFYKAILDNRFVPAVNVMEPYYDNPLYLNSLATMINNHIKNLDFKLDRLVLTFHGIPESYIKKGDPYCCMCTETFTRLKALIDFDNDKITQTYQSRLGPNPWLIPYTDQFLNRMAEEGEKNIAIACPGFTADCLETLDEIGNEAEEEFIEAGGERLSLIPCLNDNDIWVDSVFKMIDERITPWKLQRENLNLVCPTAIEKKRVKDLK